ncbi:alpha-amylase family glycosyl hydrolase [Cerasicoccus maritimus]|uniref:alpha-amylase family glycosyl hydrolase n=1 Tax=Cerasicoccus maritimus TaxID=490089 RepID=UPI0028524F6E|nr:alpha-amylase family glycosyl hydrolase [Cerasicoccus maritimus]
MIKYIDQAIFTRIKRRLYYLYGDQADQLTERLYYMVGRYGVGTNPPLKPEHRWTENDVFLITYADMVQSQQSTPLATLKRFATEHLKGAISTVHILPFYPWSSDDGFSVIDYREVKEDYGDWKDVENLGDEFKLMFDLVCNHCSSQSPWFRDFLIGISPASEYFVEMDPETDLSAVVRPRTSPLLTKTTTRDGDAYVWTTFSADQVDLNWKNPDLLFEFLDILMVYISHGATTVRLDACAFMWKEVGTDCLHLPQTHEIIKLMRDFCELVAPEVLIITETNVPHDENVSYFGRNDEAHMVYNFSLPPLLLHALLTNSSKYLTKWAKKLEFPDPGEGTFFNFTASHDGVGVRPLQGLLPQKEFDKLIHSVEQSGAHVSKRTLPDGSQSPYELNITYFSALSGRHDSDGTGAARFLCSQAVALAFKGVPAVYFHSLVATPNYHEGVEQTGAPRTINRRKYDEQELMDLLGDKSRKQGKVFRKYLQMLRRRTNYPAFHPDGDQKIIDAGPNLFALERTSPRKNQTVFCVFNFSDEEQTVVNPKDTELLKKAKKFYDILSGKTHSDGSRGIKLAPYQAMWLVPRVE